MKTNDLDDLFKKKKLQIHHLIQKNSYDCVCNFSIVFYNSFLYFQLINVDNNTYEIKTNGEQYEKGNFFKYQEIYVFTLNDGQEPKMLI